MLDYLDEKKTTPDGRTWINVGFYYWDDYEGEGVTRYMDGTLLFALFYLICHMLTI